MTGRLAFAFHLGSAGAPTGSRRSAQGPLRALVIGDFATGSERGPLRVRQPARVDVDDLEARLATLQPCVVTDASPGDGPVALAFRSLEDFHPDRLCRQVPLLRRALELRARLASPTAGIDACEDAARLLAVHGAPRPSVAVPGGAPAAPEPLESDAATLARLLGNAPERRASGREDVVERLARAAVAPHLAPPEPAQATVYRAALDDLAGRVLRGVLHDPAVRALEAAWRGLAWLVSGVGGDEVEWWMLDATRDELEQDLLGGDLDLSTTALHGLLVARARDGHGDEPWSLLIGDFHFGPAARDAQLLGALGTLARGAGAPFLAGALPALLGCARVRQLADTTQWTDPTGEGAEAWAALRRSAAARWLALALPRLLLRLPYGPRSDAIDGFPFDETSDPADDDPFLWGCPALAPALILARAYAESGRVPGPDAVRDLDDLPAYVRDTAEGRALLPCAEALLPENAVQALIRRGLVPLVSHRDAPRVRVPAIPSLAAEAAPLAGPWATEVP